jgi:ubiquinone biosynthesis protein
MSADHRVPDALQERIRDRRRDAIPCESSVLAWPDGLVVQIGTWQRQLAPVRAATASRVAELTGPGRPVARARRFALVLLVLVWEAVVFTVADLPRVAVGRRTAGQGAAHRLRRAFEHLGPSYIKLGQFISSGRGLFPDVLVEEFAACRDRAPSLSARKVRAALERELGPIAEHFASFDPQPLAAASIAQVHAAVLQDGTPVVVKVQRPGIATEVAAHIRSMPPLARLVDRVAPDLPVADPMAVVRVFAHTILEELDFRLEAQNMVDIALDLEAAAVDDVVVPRPIPGMVTPRVLVMERLEGMHFADLEQMRAAGIDTGALLRSGLRSLIEGATIFGRFHGDLHAGNVVCLPDGRFGLVDFGICARLDADERAGLQQLLVAIATRDSRAQVQGLDAMGAIPDDTDRRELIAKLMAASHDDAQALSVDDLVAGAPRLMQVFVDHRLDLPPGLVLFFKDVLYLNGSTRLLAPDLNLLDLFAELHQYFDDKYGNDRVELGADPYGPPVSSEEVAAVTRPEADERPAAAPSDAPSLGAVGRRFGPRALTDALLPLALFLTVNTRLGLGWAMAAVTLWSIGLVLVRRRGGRTVGFVLPIVVGYLVLRAAAGILTQSEAVFFGPGILNNFVIAGVFLLSVAVRRPVIGLIAQAFYPFPRAVRRHPTFHRVFSRLTVAWAAFVAGTGVLQIVLLATVSTNTYLLARAAVSWPLAIALFVVSLRYPRAAFVRDPEVADLLGVEDAEQVPATVYGAQQ